jgi:hypothetical protein
MTTPVRITGLTVSENPELTAGGWVRRTVTTAQRADEMSQLYSEIGFEVMVRPLDESSYAEDCTGCASGPSSVVLYTRRPSEQAPPTNRPGAD